MIQKILLLMFGVAFFALITAGKDSGETILKSSGSHISSTGAPGEQTCGKAGCHVDAAIELDNDFAFTSLALGAGEKTYKPATLYSISLKAKKADVKRFGFQILALDSNNRSIGTFAVPSGSTKVQLQKGAVNGFDRNYVTHTTSGNKPAVVGEIEWKFNWTSSQKYQGKVTFYYCVNTTNFDDKNTGDQLYVASVPYMTSTSGVEVNTQNLPEINIYPTIANDYLTVENPSGFSPATSYSIVSIGGAILLRKEIDAYSPSVAINLETLANGYYTLLVTTGESRIAKQFVVLR